MIFQVIPDTDKVVAKSPVPGMGIRLHKKLKFMGEEIPLFSPVRSPIVSDGGDLAPAVYPSKPNDVVQNSKSFTDSVKNLSSFG